MVEITCSNCGERVRGDVCPRCRAATAIATPEHAEHAKMTPAASSDVAFSAGPPAVQPGRGPSTSAWLADDCKSKPTFAGCFLTLLSVAVIFGSAVPIVTWRSSDSGLPLPRMIAIFAPLLAGALCYAVGAAILRLFGMSMFTRPTRPTDNE